MGKYYDLESMKKIPFLKNYFAYKNGRVYKYKSGRYAQLREYRLPYSNYLNVYVCEEKDKKSYQVHKLIASAFFHINPKDYLIIHKDKNPTNNVPENLLIKKKPKCNDENTKEQFLNKETKNFESILLNYINHNKEDPLWKEYKSIKSTNKLKTIYNWLKVTLLSNRLL